MVNKLLPNQGKDLDNHGKFQNLIGKFNYMTITRLGISFAVCVVSYFLLAPKTNVRMQQYKYSDI